MVSCARCWLQKSIRVVNVMVNVYGVAMIVYSLWLLKKWQFGVSELPNLYLIKPWFIHACIGVGIGVCLSTLFGYMVTNSTNTSTLFCIYILFICSLLSLQIVVIVAIFFRINWVLLFSKYIDENHAEYESFMKINLSICRLTVIIALVPQIYVIVLAMIVWGTGSERMNAHLNSPDFRQSFLVVPNSPISGLSAHLCCPNILLLNSPTPPNPSPTSLQFLFRVFRSRFPSRPTQIHA